jgi:hypothetical protein
MVGERQNKTAHDDDHSITIVGGSAVPSGFA